MDRPKFVHTLHETSIQRYTSNTTIRHLTLLRWKRLQNLSTQSCLQTLIRKQIAITTQNFHCPRGGWWCVWVQAE